MAAMAMTAINWYALYQHNVGITSEKRILLECVCFTARQMSGYSHREVLFNKTYVELSIIRSKGFLWAWYDYDWGFNV